MAEAPSAGEGLKRLKYRTETWDSAFAGHVATLKTSKPVILTGDFNCAHKVTSHTHLRHQSTVEPLLSHNMKTEQTTIEQLPRRTIIE